MFACSTVASTSDLGFAIFVCKWGMVKVPAIRAIWATLQHTLNTMHVWISVYMWLCVCQTKSMDFRAKYTLRRNALHKITVHTYSAYKGSYIHTHVYDA